MKDAFGRMISGIIWVVLLVMGGQPIGHWHDDVFLDFLLQRPEFISVFLSYLNLEIPARIE